MHNFLKKIKLYGPIQFCKFAVGEWHYKLFSQQIKNSFSQYQEDLLIDQLLGNKKKGFYVDVGANDPIRFNNTYRFYKKGWRGINIEPNPTCYKVLSAKRPNDINLEIGIGTKQQIAHFYEFSPHTLSTFSEKSARKYRRLGFELVKKHKIEVKKLADILIRHAERKKIDFMSIDTEGNDLEVLKSNNWKTFRPQIICVEMSARKLTQNADGETNKGLITYLKNKHYKEIYNNKVNAIWENQN